MSFVSDGLIFKNSLTDLNQGWQIRGPSAEGRFVRGEGIFGYSPKDVFTEKIPHYGRIWRVRDGVISKDHFR